MQHLKVSVGKFILLVLCVDNILVTNNDVGLLHDTKKILPKRFWDARPQWGILVKIRDSQNTYINRVIKHLLYIIIQLAKLLL